MLEILYTDVCANMAPLPVADSLIPDRLQPVALRRLLGRKVESVPAAKIACLPGFGVRRLLGKRKKETPGERRRRYVRQNAEFGRLVARRRLGQANVVYVFNGAGLEILQYAKNRSIRTILDQTSAPVAVEEELMGEEYDRWPGWEFEKCPPTDWEPMARREEMEWKLADQIICGSAFSASQVAARNGAWRCCSVVPYGVSDVFCRNTQVRGHDGPLRVLFVGAVRLQKGIQYLMEAARLLRGEKVHVRAVGPLRVSERATAELGRRIELIGPVPRSQILQHYDWADLFVFPSICEGSANVCYEALAMGVPVVTTENAGSVVRDGVEGYIVPIRSPELIAERIMKLASDRKLLQELSRNAILRAKQYTWDRYAQRLLSVITNRVDPAEQP
jgi:glycosyltransferase involved in cell wall biosynthesis